MSGETYAAESLAHCGFVIDDVQTATKLRPDIASAGHAASFCGAVGRVAARRGATPYKAILADRAVKVWAVWPGNLAQRIEWVIGEKVLEVVPESAANPKPTWTALTKTGHEKGTER